MCQGIIRKNNKLVFEDGNTDPASFFLSVYRDLGFSYPKFHKMDNLCKLGWLASEILLKDNFDAGRYEPEETGLVLANRYSSLDDDIRYWESAKEAASPSLFVYTLPNIVIGEICIRNNFKGEHAFYILPDFDADFIANQVDYLVDNNILQACICGWVDVIGTEYKAALFLIEKQEGGQSVPFSAENMNTIFKAI